MIDQERGQLRDGQLVVIAASPRPFHHARRQIDANQPPGIGAQRRPAQPGAAPGVQHVERSPRLAQPRSDRRADQFRRAVLQAVQMLVKIVGHSIEQRLYIVIGRPLWHFLPRMRGQHVPGHRVGGINRQPVLEHRDRFLAAL
ncbi:MAG: hypothetical protein V9H25_10810 [Candidatus Competibacter sp.]